jgi:hypothetical protein
MVGNGIVSNPETGDVIVKINRDGQTREYTLKLSINASVQLQQRRKRPLGDIIKDFASMDVEAMRDVLFCLLQRHHKEEIKTQEAAGQILEDIGATRFFNAFTEVMRQGSVENAATNGNPLKAAPMLSDGDSSTSTAAGPE